MAPSTLVRCEREIHRLHDFFESWFAGTCPADDETFDRLSDALGRDFTMIIPEGQTLQRSELLQAIRTRHGFRSEDDFSIQIEDVSIRADDENFAVATYEEWQHIDDERDGRISSAVFSRDPGAADRLRWHHVHESWLERPRPDDLPDPNDP